MTDHTNDIDQAERIKRLQARRAAGGRTPRSTPTASATQAAAAAPTASVATRAAARPRQPGTRRRHPAAATRWLLGGLSIASFFGIAGTVAAANVSAVATPAPAAATATVAAASSAAPSTATPVAATPRATTHAAPAAHTTTKGS